MPFNAKLYLKARQDPAMAVVSFLAEMEAKWRQEADMHFSLMMADMEKKMIKEIQAHSSNSLEVVMGKINMLKGDKGDKPKAGEDFPTHEQILTFIEKTKPKKGVHYFTAQEIAEIVAMVQSQIVIPQPENGKTPIRGVDYPSFDDIESIIRLQMSKLPQYDEQAILIAIQRQFPRLGLKGEDIILEINALPLKAPYFIPASRISGLKQATRQRQISGSGKGAGLGTAALLTVSGTIDDSNVTFTVSEEPAVLLINGGMYRKTGGAITWTYSGGTITLSVAVGTGGAIYGIR